MRGQGGPVRPCVSTGAGTCALAVGICEVKCPLVLAKMFPDWGLSGSLLVNACLHLYKQIINPLHDYQLIERGHAYDQSAGKRTVRSWAEESWGSALLQQPPLWVPGTPHDMRG